MPTFEKRKDLLFVGGFQHPPNIDTLEYLVNKIFPQIKEKLPDVKLYVIGSNAPQSIVSLCENNDGVIFLGHIRNLETYLKECRVHVAPIRFGAGVKGKITQSMAYGLPVVTTKIGAEGISNENEDVLEIANEQNFAGKTFAVYNDEELWNKLSKNSTKKIAQEFSPEVVRETLNAMILKMCF